MTKFSNVAHLYLGVDCKTPYGIMRFNHLEIDSRYKAWFDVGNSTNQSILDSKSENGKSFSFRHIKPILRKIEDMTDDETEHLAFISTANVSQDGHVTVFAHTAFTGMTRMMTYLLKNRFDLFELIDNGEAIDIKSL